MNGSIHNFSLDTTGDFILCAYSHTEPDFLHKVICRMEGKYRFWFDKGTKSGGIWQNTVARKIDRCTVFLPLVSNAYIRSQNCRDELVRAKNLQKIIVPVYIEEIDFKNYEGIEMMLEPGTPIRYYEYGEAGEDAFFEKLFGSEGFSLCKKEPSPEGVFWKRYF